MSWKTLDENIKEHIVSKCAGSSMQLLQQLIDEYNFWYYTDFDDSFPVLDCIGSYKFRLSFVMADSSNREKFDMLRELTNSNLDERIFDHAILLKTLYGDIYIVSNPYADDEYLNATLNKYFGTNRYTVLGKDRSYYNPNNTNIFLVKLS
jgi:hypothetical protein